MIFHLHGAQRNSDLESSLPIRGMDHLHHSQCLLINPIDRELTISCSTPCLHCIPWPQTVAAFKSEAVIEGLRSKTIVKSWLVYIKVQGTMCLSPILSFKCLSKGQVMLAMEKGSVYKGYKAASQGLILQSCLLDIWSTL